MLIYEIPFRDIKVGVWCAMSATGVTGPVFSETVQLCRYIALFVLQFFEHRRQFYALVESVFVKE